MVLPRDGATALDVKSAIVAAANQQFAICGQKVITGDGTSHTLKMRFARATGTGTVTITNTLAANAPKMRFMLMPSN